MFVDIFDHHILPTAWGKKKKRLNNNDAEIKFKHTGQHLLGNQLQTYDIWLITTTYPGIHMNAC